MWRAWPPQPVTRIAGLGRRGGTRPPIAGAEESGRQSGRKDPDSLRTVGTEIGPNISPAILLSTLS